MHLAAPALACTLGIALACNAALAAPPAEADRLAAAAPTLRLGAVKLAALGPFAAPTDAGGALDVGAGCSRHAVVDSTESLRQRVEAELPAAFERELAATRLGSARYASVGRGLEISAFVNDLNARVCHVGGDAWRGRFYVQVSWQVAQRRSGHTIYQASTSGFYDRIDASAATVPAAGLREAFAMAIRNLLTDARLAAVLQPAESDDETLASAMPY